MTLCVCLSCTLGFVESAEFPPACVCSAFTPAGGKAAASLQTKTGWFFHKRCCPPSCTDSTFTGEAGNQTAHTRPFSQLNWRICSFMLLLNTNHIESNREGLMKGAFSVLKGGSINLHASDSARSVARPAGITAGSASVCTTVCRCPDETQRRSNKDKEAWKHV